MPDPTPDQTAKANVDYVRRYLNDSLTISTKGPTVVVTPTSESNYTIYLRRYLNDPSN